MHRPLLLLAVACGSESAPTSEPPPFQDEAGPTLREVAFFQGVEVAVWVAPDAVDAADRNAPIVAGRDAVVRALVDAPAGWTADLTLAVDLGAGGATETFTAAGPPGVDLVASVPASALRIDSTYVVRLLAGDEEVARFPEGAPAPLAAIETGGVKVRLVPFDVGGFVPDTSAAVVDGYREALLASYPITEAELTVAPVETWDGEGDLGDILVRLGEIQEAAMVAGEVEWDVYYYGMVTGVASRDEFDGVTGTSEHGGSEALVRAYFAVGAAFGDARAEGTLLHELGHVHGLGHTLCDGGEDDPDPNYPHPGGVIGVEGYDRRTGTFLPADTPDLMTYCDPRWLSDYGYARIAEHVVGAQDYRGYE